MTTLRNYIGGEWIAPGGVEFLDLTNPATGEPLGKVPLSGTRAVNEAVAAAQTAFLKWREVPPVVLARYLFKLKYLMEEHFEDLAQTVTREHGKTLDESRGSVRRGIENVEHACGIPTLMMARRWKMSPAASTASTYASRSACLPRSRPSTSPRWSRAGSGRMRSPPATRSS